MRLTVKRAMSSDDLQGRIGAVTGLQAKALSRLLIAASPRQLVRSVLSEHWPTTAERLGDISATTAAKLDLAEEISAVSGIPPADVRALLADVHGNTRVCVALGDSWEQEAECDDEEADEEDEPLGEAELKLAGALAEGFTKADLRQMMSALSGEADDWSNARLAELAEGIVRYTDASVRNVMTPEQLRHLSGNCGLATEGGKVAMFQRLLVWAAEAAPPTTLPPMPGTPINRPAAVPPMPGTPINRPAASPSPVPVAFTRMPAAHRVRALVIGNQGYSGKDKLHNPRKDAADLSSLLNRLGHDVVTHVDLDAKSLVGAVRDFKKSVQPGDGALFYFSGHGLEYHGENWLLPIGFGEVEPEELEHESLSVTRVLNLLDHARFRVCMLDACRFNSYKARMRGSSGEGLRALQPPEAPGTEGTLICFATSPGKLAYDGTRGENGEYTAAVLRALAVPGRRIEEVLKEVRRRVSEATNRDQVPWENSSLTGDWYPAGP